MLIENRELGYAWDTVKRVKVPLPNNKQYKIDQFNKDMSLGNLDNYKELFGVEKQMVREIKPKLKYLITEQEYNLATQESVELVEMTYNHILSELMEGRPLDNSVLISLGHKARVSETSEAVLLNAHIGGLTYHKITHLSILKRDELEELNREVLVIIAPHIPNDYELTTLITLLELRNQKSLATIIVTSKYSVNPYRLILNTEDEDRRDLALLIALQQERTVENLSEFARGTNVNLDELNRLEDLSLRKPEDKELGKELDRQIRSNFIEISREHSVNATKTLFGIGGQED